jgi:type II secretory pathway component PulF
MRALLKNKKGLALGDMYPAVLTIVLVGIILGIGLFVLAEVEPNVGGGQASTAINTTVTGLGGLASWIAVIVVVIAAAIVLGVVISSFGGKGRGI